MADLRSAAFSSLKNKLSSFSRDRPSSRIAATAASTTVSLRPGSFARWRRRLRAQKSATLTGEHPAPASKPDDVALRGGDDEAIKAPRGGGGGGAGEATAREVSRRQLRGQLLRGARRRPLLVMRVGAAVVAATSRVAGTVSECATKKLGFGKDTRRGSCCKYWASLAQYVCCAPYETGCAQDSSADDVLVYVSDSIAC